VIARPNVRERLLVAAISSLDIWSINEGGRCTMPGSAPGYRVRVSIYEYKCLT